MEILKKIYSRLFEGAMTGLTMGIFATVVAGTLMYNIGMLVGGTIGGCMVEMGNIAIMTAGLGIGAGVAGKLGAPAVVSTTASVAGFFGSYATQIFSGTFLKDTTITCKGMGDMLTAFIAAYIATEVGCLIAGKTKMDYILVPPLALTASAVVTFYVGKPISDMMVSIGDLINWSMEKNTVVMGAIVAMIMCLATVLPVSSLALAMALNLSGAAGGAATVGCCVGMIGFATCSFKENRVQGFILQSVGSAKLQIPNIIKNPLIILPILLTSAILGPLSVSIFNLSCNSTGAGLGSCGLMAQLMTYQSMITVDINRNSVITQIVLFQFLLPAIGTLAFSEFLRMKGLIKENDMKIDF